jgi:UPF0755 protein
MARRSRPSLRFLLLTLLITLLPFAGGWWTLRREGPLREEVTFLVKRGATVDQVSRELERAGVIRSAFLFKVWARTRRLQLIRGEYTASPGTSLAEVADKLRRGDVHYTSVVISPSLHAWSLQRRLQAFVPEDVFWSLWHSPRLAKVAGFPEAESLEGLVAPATYRLHHALEPEEVMLMLVEAFREQVLPRLQGGPLGPYATLTLASLVEKETSLPEERPEVAGVYSRRLAMGMRLQCDPTSLYARWLTGDLRFTAPLRFDTERPHRFNTYSVAGLPPTPIAIPSSASIAAAKAPRPGKSLYFVATGQGGHRFAPSLQEHNRNVGVYRQEMTRQRLRR